MYDELVNKFFPHRDDNGRPSFRKHQRRVIIEILEALDDDSVTDVVAELPTGAGKTSIAVTVARIASMNFGKNLALAREIYKRDQTEAQELLAGDQVHMITSMKLLQDAYLGDDKNISLMKGKTNYRCRKGGSCDEAESIFGAMCRKGCRYKKAKKKAHLTPIALHNFDSFLYQATLGGGFVPRRLLTIDEAHNTEEKLRGFMTMVMDRDVFDEIGVGWNPPSSFSDIDAVVEWGGNVFRELEQRSSELEAELKAIQSAGSLAGYEQARRIRPLARLTKISQDLATKVKRFYRSSTAKIPATWISEKIDSDAFVLKPVDVGRFVPNAIHKFGEKRLHLSATFLDDVGVYGRSVRIKEKSTRRISAPSTFPVESRLITMRPCGDLGARDWKKNFQKCVSEIKKIILENKGVRGVIHCTSYVMAEEISEAIGDKRILPYERSSRADVVGRFLSGQVADDAVLLAVSLTEGYDFKYDLCRFQVMIRVPYIVPDKCVKKRSEKDGRFYGWRTALSLVQTYGRGTRAADDFCKTYILDSRFERFCRQESDQLPKWFKEAMR